MTVLTAEQSRIVRALTRKSYGANLSLEELTKRYDRLQKFGFSREEKRDPPVEPAADAIFLKDSLYLHGVDYMSTENVKEFFGKHEVDAVNWLNDSSCIFYLANKSPTY